MKRFPWNLSERVGRSTRLTRTVQKAATLSQDVTVHIDANKALESRRQYRLRPSRQQKSKKGKISSAREVSRKQKELKQESKKESN
jgi:hypothetical protein